MKKQLFAALLAICLALSQLPTYALAVDAERQEGNVAAGVPAAQADVVPAPGDVYKTLIAFRDKDGYTEGTSWTDANHEYRWKGGPINGANILATGCVAFAFELSDAAFGSLPARTDSFSLDKVKAGDILRMNTDTHSVIVLEVNEAGIVVAEGNYSGTVHWGRAISRDVLERDVSTYITRYPEGYIPPDDPSGNETAASGTLGGLAWNLTKAGTLTISGSGAMPADFSGPGDQPWYAYSSDIRKIVIENGVTSVGSSAFYNCAAMSVEIPSSVTAIGNHAFHGCALMDVKIPSSVKTIGDDAFLGCPNLASVIVSEGVESVGERVFQSCVKLSSAELPASLKRIGAGAFYDCEKLWSVKFAPGSNQVTMGDNLFSRCWMLSDVTLPKSIDHISAGMFDNCYMALTSVTIPQGAAKIGASAFASCRSLVAVTIPDSITDIETAAFSACDSLQHIYFTGTEVQWNNIWKSADVKAALANVTVHYNSAGPGTDPDPGHKEHTWGSGTVTKAATCTEDGTRTYTCSVCGETMTEAISAAGHKYGAFVVTKEPTEQEDGEKTAVCSVCGAKTTEKIPANKHNHDNFIVTKQPTCTEPGEKTATCSICGTSWTEVIPAVGHSFKISSSTSPTCTASGRTTYTCTVCGQTKVETDSALGHTYRYSSTTQPTCTTAGSTTYTCTRCGHTGTEVLPATGHSYSVETTEPTCTEQGSTIYTCPKCGITRTDTIPALGHQYETTTKDPTCTEDGSTAFACARCGEQHEEAIPALGHDFQAQADGSCICQRNCGAVIPAALNAAYRDMVNNSGNQYPEENEADEAAIQSYLQGRLVYVLDKNHVIDYICEVINGHFIDNNTKYQYQVGFRRQSAARAAGSGYDLVTEPIILLLPSDGPDMPEVIAYTIRYDANGGTGKMDSTVVKSGERYQLPDCEFTAPDGLAFKAWLINGIERQPGAEYRLSDTSSETHEITVTAIWTKVHTIIFDANGGTGKMEPVLRMPDGYHYRLPECEFTAPDGMEFKAWEVTGIEREVNAEYIIKPEHDVEITVKAIWSPKSSLSKTYAITFDANGGTDNSATVSTDINGRLASLPAPIRDGYIFKGWYTAKTGGSAVTVETVFNADTTIYAQWQENAGGPTGPAPSDIQINGISSSSIGKNMFLITLPAGSVLPAAKDITIPAEAEELKTADNGQTWTFVIPDQDGVRVTYTLLVKIEEANRETYYIFVEKPVGGEVLANTRYAEEGERVTLSIYPAADYELDTLTVRDIRGRTLTLRSLGGNRYSFTMPDSRVTAEASFVRQTEELPSSVPGTEHTAQEPSGEAFTSLGTPGIAGIVLNPSPMPFTDVRVGSWFYNNVDYVWKHYLMSGVSDTQFAPGTTTSRAMIWTILARMNNIRTDINPGSTWYERGMLWAMERGVTDGSHPMNDITREQLAVMLWRNAGSPGGTADLNKFSDSGSVSDYAVSAIRWAVTNGILQGSDGKLNPKGTATRAEVAAMVQRYGERIGA